MAGYDISLSSTDVAKTSTGPVSLGGVRGGGLNFTLGGINDSPGGKWIWIGLAVAAVAVGGFLWFTSRKKGRRT